MNVLIRKFKSPDELIDIMQRGSTDVFGLEHYQEIYKILGEEDVVCNN